MTTTSPTTPTAPAIRTRASRLIAIDATRGLALVGMTAVHSLTNVAADGGPTVTYEIFAGRAAAAYAILAGVGIAFVTGRRRMEVGPTAAGRSAGLVVRALLIGAIGLLLGYTDAANAVVILPYYAAIFLMAIPLTFLSTRVLASATVGLAVAAPVLSQVVRPHLPETIYTQLTFGDLIGSPMRFASTIMFGGEFPAVVWLTYVAAGMLVARLDLRSVAVQIRLLACGVAMAVAAPLTSWVLLTAAGGRESLEAASGHDVTAEFLAFGGDGVVPADSWWWLAAAGPHTGTPLDLMATIGSTIAILGLLLALWGTATGAWRTVCYWMMLPLVATGALSLTFYVAHVVFINSDFDVYGPVSGWLRQLAVFAVVGIAWRWTAGRGPLEGLIAGCTRRTERNVRRFVTSAPRSGVTM